jgi:hypothetical protein
MLSRVVISYPRDVLPAIVEVVGAQVGYRVPELAGVI